MRRPTRNETPLESLIWLGRIACALAVEFGVYAFVCIGTAYVLDVSIQQAAMGLVLVALGVSYVRRQR